VRLSQWLRLFVVVILFASWLGLPSWAQSTNATVNGLVLDSSAAVVVGATVQAINDGSGVIYPTKTNASGIYAVPDLPPGTYHIQVAQAGFKTLFYG
jgi:Carboxypeptidase regulatory-like domain